MDPRVGGLGQAEPNSQVPFEKHFQVADVRDHPRGKAVIYNPIAHLALNFLVCITIFKMYVRQFQEINFVVSSRNCLASMLDYIVMQMKQLTMKRAVGQQTRKNKHNARRTAVQLLGHLLSKLKFVFRSKMFRKNDALM